MHASKEKTTFATSTSLKMMLSRSYSSKEEFMRDYAKLYGRNSKSKKFYLFVLVELEKAISGDDIESLKKLSSMIAYTSDLESKVTWRECYDNTGNPIRSTNLVILASKYNRIKILQYLLDSDSELLNYLSVGIGKDFISPKDKDEVHHNAFYYAIRSEDTQLLDTLITNKYFNNNFADHSEELEEILSKTYEELQLKNVPLSDEMQYSVEHKLIDKRFFSTGQQPITNTADDFMKTKKRIELLLDSIKYLKEIYLKSNIIDGIFMYVVKFIAQNIFILKGRLRSTYNRIPWEEMEFCLVIFISSHTSMKELNLFYPTILHKDKILNYLNHFADVLNKEKILKNLENLAKEFRENKKITKGMKLHCLPRVPRDAIIKTVIKTYPEFKELYTDYQQVRDIYSLKRIDDHIKLAVSANAEEDQGQFVIIRVLQVIGEQIKNTLETPKLSHTTSDILIDSLSQSAQKYIAELRDAISHADSLSKIMEIEEEEKNANKSFFIDIQNDVRKVGDVITDIFYKTKMKTIKMLLKKVAESKTFDEMKEILKELDPVASDAITAETFKTLEYEKLRTLIKELSDSIVEMTNYEKKLFNKINDIIKSAENQTHDVSLDYIGGFLALTSLKYSLSFNNSSENDLESNKEKANSILNSKTEKVKREKLEEIGLISYDILQSVASRMQSDHFFKGSRLTRNIIRFVNYETGKITSIEEFREKLPKPKRKKSKLTPEETIKINNHFEQKLNELKIILNKNSLISEFKSDRRLQTVVKMLVLDIMVILGEQNNCLQNNILFIDDNTPLLHGNCLRNFLAHDNALVDVLLSDPFIAVLSNANKLTTESIIKGEKIGKLVSDDPATLRYKFYHDLDIIANQERMFCALEEGDLDGFQDCIEKGADIKGRSAINSWTALHFAAKGPSAEAVRFIFDQNVSVNVKDNSGDTPLHIAAAHGRQEILNLFLNETDICVDVLNNKGETPLHFAVKNGHKDIVEDLLRNKANISTPDALEYPPLYYALMNNHIDIVKILLRKHSINDTMREWTALQIAANYGHLKLVNILLESGANIDATTDRTAKPLHMAAYSGHLEVVNALILRGADVNARTINGCTPLHFATRSGNIKVVDTLLTHEAHVNTTTNAFTPLHIASEHGNLKIVTALCKRGADIHSKHNNFTPLDLAASNGQMVVVEFLTNKMVRINTTNNSNITALHEALRYGHKNVAHFLIQKNKADVNAKSQEGETALHVAAFAGHKDMIKLLIENEAEVDARFSYGITALHIAVVKGHEAAVEFLIENKANINSKNIINSTPLHLAVQYRHKKIVELLLENNAQIDLEDSRVGTPLHEAAEAGHQDIVELLVVRGANINYKHNNRTPLFYAIKNNRKNIVKFLIENGANVKAEDIDTWSLPFVSGYTDVVEIFLEMKAFDVNCRNAEHSTPLHIAAENGYKKIVKDLINAGADVHAININNKTPLFGAAQEGFEQVVEILIKYGAKVNLKNSDNFSPLQLSALTGHSQVVKVLLDNKADIDVTYNFEDETPIRLAVAGGHLETVKILLESTAVNRNAKDEIGSTLLHTAAMGNNLELVKYLVDEGFEINAINKQGFKAIHLAALHGFKEGVEFFVGVGLTVNEPTNGNQTLLHYATKGAHLEVVNYLIEHRADVNAKMTTVGITPMHFAATAGYIKIIQVLLENGAVYNPVALFHATPLYLAENNDVIQLLGSTDKLFKAVKKNSCLEVQNSIAAGAFVNAKNTEDNVTPLHYAAWKGYDEVARVLLQNKANPNVVNSKGLTPLHCAALFSHLKVVKTLLSYYAVYNPVFDGGKTPSDLTKNESIINLFKSVGDSIKYVEMNNHQVIDNLNKMADIDTVKAIMCACNSENKTLVVVAMHSNFSEIQQLKEIGQGDVSAKINKAIALYNYEDFEEALRIFKYAFETRKEILGSDNPATLEIEKYIADILHHQGYFQEALYGLVEILRKEKEILGCESRNALKTKSFIASVMYSQGIIELAFNMITEVYQKQVDLLGSDDIDTLITEWKMVILALNGVENSTFKELLNNLQSIIGNITPENLPNDIFVQCYTAIVLENQGYYKEAFIVYTKLHEKINADFGHSHSYTLTLLANIGKILAKQKNYNESLTVFNDILNVQKQVLRTNHPNILKTQLSIGNVLFAQRKWISALEVYNEGFEQGIAIFEPNHPDVLNIRINIKTINLILKLEGIEPSNLLQNFQNNINVAASQGDIQIIQILLEDGFDANHKDQDGRTPLHFAIYNGHINVVKMLLKRGADVTRVTNRGNTPLHTVSSKGYGKIADILLQHTSSYKLNYFINAKNTDGGATPLHVAAKYGFLDIAMSLLKRGAIYNITNNEGKTPLDLCEDVNISDVLKLVEELFQDAKDGNVEIIKKLTVLKPEEFLAVTNARDNQDYKLLEFLTTNKHQNLACNLSEMLKENVLLKLG